MQMPSTRQEALDSGEKYYQPAEPCTRGHAGPWLAKRNCCVECNKENCRAYYRRNAEAVIAQKREYQAANRSAVLAKRAEFRDRNRDRLREECRAYHEAHREERRQYSRQWRASLSLDERKEFDRKNREKHREERAAHRREWGIATGYKWHRVNPEGQAAKNARRRVKILQAEGTYTDADVRRLTKKQGGRCACCGQKKRLEVDHIQPLAKGGSNWPSNLQMLCKPCNSKKAAKDPIEFMQQMGALL